MTDHDTTTTKQANRPKRRIGYALGGWLVLIIALLCVGGFVALFLRQNPDPGIRIWILNHTPDQVVIINPFNGVREKSFTVGDGLRELAFSRDYSKAYIVNMVEVTNSLKVYDTETYLVEETIDVDGIPQGVGVFPNNDKMAMIIGSKEDFMAGGFDVIDLERRSQANAEKRLKLYRERDLSLSHKLAISDDSDRIYCIDAKDSRVFIFSLAAKERIGELNLNGAAEDMIYPAAGDYYFVSVLQHETIYQISKETDQVVGALVYDVINPNNPYARGKLRYMAVDSTAEHLFGTNHERDAVAVWEIDNPGQSRLSTDEALGYRQPEGLTGFAPDRLRSKSPQFDVPYYLPAIRFKLKGGYDPRNNYVPGGQQIAVDPRDDYVFVMDDEGALYIYDMYSIMRVQDDLAVLEPREIVTTMADRTTEIRDMQVCRPSDSAAGKWATEATP